MQKLQIEAKFPTLNEYTNANRTNKYAGASIKKKWTKIVATHCLRADISPCKKVKLEFIWQEKNKRRDPDNFIFSKKFILDGMVKAGVLENDGWNQIDSISDNWVVNKEWQGVEVIIREVA